MVRRNYYHEKLDKLKDTDDVKIITGVRRSGKTHFLKEYMNELKKIGVPDSNIIYISFESNRYNNVKDNESLNKIIEEKIEGLDGKLYLFFDEIHKVHDWELSINGYRVDLDADIYVTGSYGQMLSGINSTVLSGRYVRMHMYPFSFNELLDYYRFDENMEIDGTTEMKIFNEFLNYGSFPGVRKYAGHDEKIDYLSDIYDSIMLKDIIEINSIGSVDLFRRLMEFMVTNIGNLFSANSIAKYLKRENRLKKRKKEKKKQVNPSTNTVIDYIRYAVDAYLLYEVKREDLKGKKILQTLEKYYVVDQGFYYLFHDENERDMGFLLENIVFLELLKKRYNVTIGKVKNYEVDFVCKRPGKTFYIQVSESINDPLTREREFNSLEKIDDNYPKYIITTDYVNYSNNGIIHLNILDFLKDSIK